MSPALPGALTSFGWSGRVRALYDELDQPGLAPARIVRVERGTRVAVFADGIERVLAGPSPAVTGDWVGVAGDAIGVVLPRWSCLTRPDPDGSGQQALAACIDLVVITAPADRLSPARIERELALAWDSGAQPLVVLTKCDLVGVADTGLMDRLGDRLAGVEVLATSGATGAGLGELSTLLRPDRTAVLLGPSGAGKSTLANALLGEARLATGAVRAGDRRGRHTTTARQLVAVPGGGVLIDTPGLRSLGLRADVALGQVFPDIEDLARSCRFNDCRHVHEPGCAVLLAVTDGTLAGGRLASFRKLEGEVGDEGRAGPSVSRADLRVRRGRPSPAGRSDQRRPHRRGA